MDLQNVSPITMSKETKKRLQKMLRENYEESKVSQTEWVEKMRKAGYSDNDINMIMLM
jgi:hypothetical protein